MSLRTTEAEWYAASEAGKEIIYLRRILSDFSYDQVAARELYEGSRAVITAMADNPINRKGSRLIHTLVHP